MAGGRPQVAGPGSGVNARARRAKHGVEKQSRASAQSEERSSALEGHANRPHRGASAGKLALAGASRRLAARTPSRLASVLMAGALLVACGGTAAGPS